MKEPSMSLRDDLVEGDFWAKVNRGAENECWEWRSQSRSLGYGTVKIKGRSYRAHRVAYQIAKGPIPAGLIVLHSCDNRACCNPAHLSAGTYLDNMRDMLSRNRQKWQYGEESPHAKMTNDLVMRIRVNLVKGRTQQQTMTDLGVSYADVAGAVYHWKHLPFPDGIRRRAVVTKEQVEEALRLVSLGLTYKQAGDRAGISETTVARSVKLASDAKHPDTL